MWLLRKPIPELIMKVNDTVTTGSITSVPDASESFGFELMPLTKDIEDLPRHRY